jgi:hypothetical protein
MRSLALLCVCTLFALPAIAVGAGAGADGTYAANGKAAELTHVMAVKGHPFGDKPTTKLVFSEKDASGDKSPAFNAANGAFGAALVVTLVQNANGWKVIGSQFAHPALQHSGGGGIGIVEAIGVKLANGELGGRIASVPDADLFHEPLSIDVTFSVAQP